MIQSKVVDMSSRYKVEKVSFGFANGQLHQYEQKLNEIIPKINNGEYADDGWMLVSITPISATELHRGTSYTSHLILLFKRL